MRMLLGMRTATWNDVETLEGRVEYLQHALTETQASAARLSRHVRRLSDTVSRLAAEKAELEEALAVAVRV